MHRKGRIKFDVLKIFDDFTQIETSKLDTNKDFLDTSYFEIVTTLLKINKFTLLLWYLSLKKNIFTSNIKK